MRKFFNRKKLGTDPELPSSTFPTHINTNPTSSNVRNKVNLFEAPLNNQLGLGLQIPNEHRNGSAHSLNDRPSNTKQKSTLLTDVAPLDLATSSPNDSRDKRQVAFVSPANTSRESMTVFQIFRSQASSLSSPHAKKNVQRICKTMPSGVMSWSLVFALRWTTSLPPPPKKKHISNPP